MKNIFIIIDIVLLTLFAFLGVELMYTSIEMSLSDNSLHLKEKVTSVKNDKEPVVLKKRDYKKIIKKNILKVMADRNEIPKDKKKNAEDISKLKATSLKLKLLGTIAGGNPEEAFAVIEDQRKKKQFLYQIGQSVQGAEIIKILRQKVVLNYQGEDQVLEMVFTPDLKIVKKKK